MQNTEISKLGCDTRIHSAVLELGTIPATFIVAFFSLNFIPKYIPIHSGLKKAVTSFNAAGATGFTRMCF